MLLTLSSSSMYMTGQDSTKNSCPHCSILYWHDGLLLLIVCIACQASEQRHRQASWGVMVNTGERQNTITDSTYIFLEYQKIVLYFKTSSVVPYYTVLVVCCDIFILW